MAPIAQNWSWKQLRGSKKLKTGPGQVLEAVKRLQKLNTGPWAESSILALGRSWKQLRGSISSKLALGRSWKQLRGSKSSKLALGRSWRQALKLD